MVPTNLHLLLILCAAPPCPPEAGELVTQGWRAYRADSIAVAAERFARADRLCENLDAKVGLGYARLRQDRLAEADSLFQLITARDSANADGWDGLTLVRWRRGDRPGTLTAARRAIRLDPKNSTTRDILKQLDPDWERRAAGQPSRRAVGPSPHRYVAARTRGDYFEVPSARGAWRRFYVNGVNLGVALPGRYPSDFPPDSSTYAEWLGLIAGMHANTVRVYTVLPPAFYRALRAWDLSHPDRALWLIHGAWAELPPRHDFNDSSWESDFREEMRRVVDLVHGNADILVRPGHAGGLYDADVSRWTLGYIIGREWEPFAIQAFERRFATPTAGYAGRYLSLNRGLHIDVWMAEQCDYLLAYEMNRYNAIRPIAYTNWPTLDPLYHVTESTAAEESAWRKKVGRPTARNAVEYDNDAVGLDAMLVRPTPENPAGWFASFHVYPYYPDFMVNDPGYATAHSREGRSNYFGYLKDLKRRHAGIPLLVSEYGVPSSRGNAHVQPQGWDHGGHDEVAMAAIDARLTREIRESGAAGGILFAWLDEWFKKNWLVIDYELPQENTRQWHNVMDPEQNYGVLGMYPGPMDSTPALGGDPARWAALHSLAEAPLAPGPDQPQRLRIGADESYLYLALEIPDFAGRDFPWGQRDILIALDSYRSDQGQRALPGRVLQGDVGFEFLAMLRDTSDAELRVTPEYNPYVGGEAIVDGDNYGRFARRPVTTASRDDGRFDSLFVITNRARFSRDGTFFPARGVNRGRLRYGTEAGSTLSDWYWDRNAGLMELRLPWNLLNVSDPSTATVLYEARAGSDIGTRRSDGIRVGVAVIGQSRAEGRQLLGALPAPGPDGRWHSQQFASWEWPTWTAPRYHERLKPVYDSLKAVWGR
jgi:hypothetical protein